MKGTFAWSELVTYDADAAKSFYTEITNWGTISQDMPEGPYLMFTRGEKPVGGVQTPKMEGVPQHWLPYISHDDVDAGTAWIKEKGGTVFMEPFSIPTVGRMSVCQDPFGAVIALFKPEQADAKTPIEVGDFCWYEHTSSNVDEARAFYEELFGWELANTMDMPEGAYHVYKIGEDSMIGFMNNTQVPGNWCSYIKVEDVDSVLKTTQSNGGNSLHGPVDLPNGRIVVLQDPQGGVFAAYADA